MAATYLDALVETAAEGISFDGLEVHTVSSSRAGTYAFRTPDVDHTGLSESDLRDRVADSPYATNWYYWHARAPQTEDRFAFLRWLEGVPHGESDPDVPGRYDRLADGIETEWGQLLITALLGDDGHRRYRLRHVADADRPGADLGAYEDPRAARGIATDDDRGRYRPLTTAPSLQTGWQFPDLGPDELVAAVDFFYPATVTNWDRERRDGLDVTHWRETVERQTGIYGVVKTWDRGEGHEHAEWVAETYCEDSQCLKRREWEYDADTELGVDGGDGHFPCREPCSLVISGARQFTKLDAEESRTYEFELTPGEKAGIEEIIDAVAEGRIDEIREGDVRDAANRYRARFLRAKRFDDDGQLCGVPTDDGA